MTDPGQLSSRIEEFQDDFNSQASAGETSGTGTDSGGAALLSDRITTISGGATGTGVCLPDLGPLVEGQDMIVFNSAGHDEKVYAAGTNATINGVAGATGLALTTGHGLWCILTSPRTWSAVALTLAS